jgi:SAM-dependent methyltransferase
MAERPEVIAVRWQRKAAIMRVAARLPFGDRLYRWGQKAIGRLRADPMNRLPMQVEMVRWLGHRGTSVQGASLFEVGAGHIPIVPIGFFLSGAARVITVDLHRRIDWGLTRDSLEWIASHRGEVQELYADVLPGGFFDERFAVVAKWRDNPSRFLKEAGIEYMAPTDAAHTDLPSQSMDCHFSVTVLEHIPPAVLADIFAEAKRVLRPNGTAIHFVDLSDHFQHQDQSITRINFLRFSDSEWIRIAGNEFAYCSRLRAGDYLRLFQEAGFAIARIETLTDPESFLALKNGLPIDSEFRAHANDELGATALKMMLRLEETRIDKPASPG